MKIRPIALSTAVACLLALTSGDGAAQQNVIDQAKEEREVIIWTQSFDNSEDFLKGFYKKYPFLRVKIWDGRTEEVVNKVITESQAGKFSPDILMLSTRGFPALQNAGLLQKYDWPKHTDRWSHQPDHRLWIIQAASVRIPAYNKDMVSGKDVPKSWEDLKSPKWRGKSVISSSGADAPLLFADLWSKPNGELDWERAFSFWRDVIHTTQPKVIRGFSRGFDAIASGEMAIFLLSSTNSGLNYIRKGAPILFAPVGRTMGSTWGVGIPKTIPHPHATRLFVDYLLSSEGMLSYSDAVAGMCVGPDICERAFGNTEMKKIGVQWYPVADEARSDEDVTKATKWWSTELGTRRGKRR